MHFVCGVQILDDKGKGRAGLSGLNANPSRCRSEGIELALSGSSFTFSLRLVSLREAVFSYPLRETGDFGACLYRIAVCYVRIQAATLGSWGATGAFPPFN